MGTPPTFPIGSTPGESELQFALDPPRASISTTSTSLADDTYTVVTFTALKWDTDGMWNAANPTRLTVQTPGLYSVTMFANLPTAAYGRLSINLRTNAGGLISGGTSVLTHTPVNTTITGATLTANTNLTGTVTFDQPIAAGDYVEMFVLQKSGATRTLAAGLLFLRWVGYL